MVKSNVGDAHGDIVDETWEKSVYLGKQDEQTNVPPPVTKLENHVMATRELLETETKDSIGKIMTTAKQ